MRIIMKATFQKEKFTFKPGEHKGKNVIWINFDCENRLKNHLREHVKVKWNNTKKAWYTPDAPVYRKLFGIEPPKPKVSKEVIIKDTGQPLTSEYLLFY